MFNVVSAGCRARLFRRASALAFALAVAACGGGGDGSSEVPGPGVFIGGTSSTIDASGGTLSHQGLTLTVPAAALPASTALSLQQETVNSPALARFRFSPAGQALATPAALRYSAAGLPSNARYFWEVAGEMWLVPGEVTGGVLSSQVTSLGYNGAGTVGQAAAASPTERAKATALRSRALADSPDAGGALVVAPVDCDVHITQLKLRLARAATESDQSRAVGIFNDLQATREACVGVRIAELQQASCDALAVAQGNARVLLASSLGAFSELTVPLYAADAFVQNTGATCSTADPADNPALIEAKFDQLLDVMKGQMARAEFDDAPTVRDLGVVLHLDEMCQKLALGASCDRLNTELYPDLLDALRASAFEECRGGGTPLSVSQFYALGSQAGSEDKFFGHARFSLAAVEADLNYCSNPALGLRVFDGEAVPGELAERATTLRPLVALGNYVNQRNIALPRDGSLNIAGTVGVLRCPDGSASGAELVVRINGQEWVRRAASGDAYPLASAPLLLDLPKVLPGFGIDPTTSTGFTVTINREGGACSDGKQAVLGAPFEVFKIVVGLDALPDTRFARVPRAGGGVYETTDCVKDNQSGLIWEGKQGQGGDRNGYYGGALAQFGAIVGANNVIASGPSYVEVVNSMALCGFSDWRVPTKGELDTLLDRNLADVMSASSPYITDPTWFPNTSDLYWYLPMMEERNLPWCSDWATAQINSYFEAGNSGYCADHYYRIRLVRP